ncbi:MAG: hypothetical protein JWM31_36, partial [Solirubrobacterales bacterium]|nr:hypothetical protein [Solirubrobacterales bacterium]
MSYPSTLPVVFTGVPGIVDLQGEVVPLPE